LTDYHWHGKVVTNMVSEAVSLRELARELSIDRSNLRKYILKQGITFEKMRTVAGKHQLELGLTKENADKIRSTRVKNGYSNIQEK